MSFSIEPKILKKLIDFYHPNNKGEQMKYLLFLKGEEEMYMNLETSPFQGISQNSIDERKVWFGQNTVTNPFKFTLKDVFLKSLTEYICMPAMFIFSLILFLIGLFFQYNSLQISYIEGLVGMSLYILNSALIFILEYGKWIDLKTVFDYQGEKIYCNVWRQNRLQQIDADLVVVGDVIQLVKGSVIPADGWIIEGELQVQQNYSHTSILADKTTLKAAVTYIDKGIKDKAIKFNNANRSMRQNYSKIQYSPVVLGGSTVTEGEGRMMVFCVGKYSRRGQFEQMLKYFDPHKRRSKLQQKMQQHSSQFFKYGILGVIVLIIVLVVKEIVDDLIDPNKPLSDLAHIYTYQYIILTLNLLMYLIPQGSLIGLTAGLLLHKKIISYNHEIKIKQLVHCQSMSYVQHICHEKQTKKSYFQIKEWWNSAGKVEILDDQNGQHPILKSSEEEEKLLKNIGNTNELFLQYFRKVMNITSGEKDFKSEIREKNKNFGSFRNLDECFLEYSRRKSFIKRDQKDKNQIIEQIPYDKVRKRTAVVANLPGGIRFKSPSISKMPHLSSELQLKIPGGQSLRRNLSTSPKKPILKQKASLRGDSSAAIDSKKELPTKMIIYVRGKPETVLELCSFIMCKETGQVLQITKQKADEIKGHIVSMLRRQLRAIVLAYKITDSGNIASAAQIEDESGYVLLAILGINDTRSTEDFELLTKIKQLGVNIMISSSNSMQLSVSAANQIGVIKADESSILINGSDFLHIIGGIVCKKCKKPICSCEHSNENHRIKNIDEFERVLKHLDVMANAQGTHKYSLVVGLRDKMISTASTGKKLIDIPSMMLSQVSLYVRNNTEDKQMFRLLQSATTIEIPNHSVQTLFTLIRDSRISNRFIRKFIRIITCSSIVSAVYLVASLILFKQDFGIKLIHIFWVQTILMTFLALALSLDNSTEDNQTFPIMNESLKAFPTTQPLINSDGWRQIALFTLTQLILLFIVTFLGTLFIPEKVDDFDSVISSNWSAKYSDSSMTMMCSGLPFSFYGSEWNYHQTFNNYGVFSRHQTFLFAFYSTLQIVNYFNFRQYSMKQVNIFKNFKLSSIILVLLTFFVNIMLVELTGGQLGFYLYGLTFEQWIICFGISMFEWIVGIFGRLIPDIRKQDESNKRKWQNKAYNLAVKAVVSKDQLSQFQVDQYFELRPQIFSNRKND